MKLLEREDLDSPEGIPMSTIAKLSGAEFDAMVLRGAFDRFEPKKVELIHGEIRFMNPAGPIHDDLIEYLTRWSVLASENGCANIRIQCGIVCDDHRPEPDILWLKPKRYGKSRPTAEDVLLLIEVSDTSLETDLREKANLYAVAGVAEYWVVDANSAKIHVHSQSDGNTYGQVKILVAPTPLAPHCQPTAILDLRELFDVLD
jgi:Uma2 family endonuclease